MDPLHTGVGFTSSRRRPVEPSGDAGIMHGSGESFDTPSDVWAVAVLRSHCHRLGRVAPAAR